MRVDVGTTGEVAIAREGCNGDGMITENFPSRLIHGDSGVSFSLNDDHHDGGGRNPDSNTALHRCLSACGTANGLVAHHHSNVNALEKQITCGLKGVHEVGARSVWTFTSPVVAARVNDAHSDPALQPRCNIRGDGRAGCGREHRPHRA